MSTFFRSTLAAIYVLFSMQISNTAFAQTAKELADMQKKLNVEVLEKPFSVADEAKVDAYIKDAMAKNLKPEVSKAPSYWRPGYSCADIYHYGWNGYRNCRYYHSYYGHYW